MAPLSPNLPYGRGVRTRSGPLFGALFLLLLLWMALLFVVLCTLSVSCEARKPSLSALLGLISCALCVSDCIEICALFCPELFVFCPRRSEERAQHKKKKNNRVLIYRQKYYISRERHKTSWKPQTNTFRERWTSSGCTRTRNIRLTSTQNRYAFQKKK